MHFMRAASFYPPVDAATEPAAIRRWQCSVLPGAQICVIVLYQYYVGSLSQYHPHFRARSNGFFFPSYLAQNAFFWLYFAETSRIFSIIFCPKCIFSPSYFAQNAVFPVHSAESTASSPASAHRSPQSDSVYPRKPK